MSSFIATFLMFLFSFCIVISAFAGKGEPTSCYKWSYNHLDGYVADNGNYEGISFSVKKTGKFYQEQQTNSHHKNKNLRLQINTRFVFSGERFRDKTLVADKR